MRATRREACACSSSSACAETHARQGQRTARHGLSCARCPSRCPIAQVTPYPWEDRHEVNTFVRAGLRRARARAGTACSSSRRRRSRALVRDSRKAVRARRARAGAGRGARPRRRRGAAAAAGPRAARRCRSTSRARSRSSSSAPPLDVCHVHEPFAPSVASAALRHSRALNVGTFHAPTERVVSTQVARKVVQLVFGRLDARIAELRGDRGADAPLLPRRLRVVAPGADAARAPRGATTAGRVRIAFVDEEERGALRLFLRALRRLDPALPWEAVVQSERGPSSSTPLRADLRERVRFVDGRARTALAGADVVVAASDGVAPAPGADLRAIAAGAVPRRLAPGRSTRSCSATASAGCCSSRATSRRSPRSSARLVADGDLRARLRGAPAAARAAVERASPTSSRRSTRDARRAPPRRRAATPSVARAARGPAQLIDVDLHMHTDHSPRLRDAGRGAAGHRARPGPRRDRGHRPQRGLRRARGAPRRRPTYGVKVIVGEEVKTAQPGRGHRPVPHRRRSRAG